MVEAYWQIGKRIVEQEQNFRQFYMTYPDPEIFSTVCRKLTWSHNKLIMRVEDPTARSYYLKESSEQGWSVRTLERNINTFYYQRLLSSRNNPETVQLTEPREKEQSRDFIKDPFVFEFLNLPQPASATEVEIESALIEKSAQKQTTFSLTLFFTITC